MKQCFKCKIYKSMSEFYKHRNMGDGHLGKCKECTKLDTNNRHRDESKREAILQAKRNWYKSEKGRLFKRAQQKKYYDKYPEKIIARTKARTLDRSPCIKCGDKAEAHHPDYGKPLEVIWLCPKHHREHHTTINGMYARKVF